MMAALPTVAVTEVSDQTVLLDVREDEEWEAGHIAGAVHIPMNEVPQRLHYQPDALPTDARLVVLCKMGGRSAQVTAWLRANGYEAANLDGGMLAWAATGRPMVTDNGADPIVY